MPYCLNASFRFVRCFHTSTSIFPSPSVCRVPCEVIDFYFWIVSQTPMLITQPGLLIECDPSIKSLILKYDEERHDYIVEDLNDENHLVVKESQLQNLKVRLDQVCIESLVLQSPLKI